MNGMRIVHTPNNVRFGMLGEKPPSPVPIVFGFGGSIEETLTLPQFNRCALLCHEKGFLCVSVDLPCYGQDVRADDPESPEGNILKNWIARIAKGEAIMKDFTNNVSSVLDHLIREGYVDSKKVAAYGHSRGAFAALHFAAVDPRARIIAAFTPLVDLTTLWEFTDMRNHEATKSLGLIHHAEKLVDRSIWICVGNDDDRVNTDRVIAFARKVTLMTIDRAKAAGEYNHASDVEMHVFPLIGHDTHPTADEEGATWINQRLNNIRT